MSGLDNDGLEPIPQETVGLVLGVADEDDQLATIWMLLMLVIVVRTTKVTARITAAGV